MFAFDWFDAVYVISLPDAAERRAAITQQLQSVGIHDWEFVYAEPPAAGFTMSNMRRNPRAEFGCNLSHARAILESVACGALRSLCVEDDIVFLPGAIERLTATIGELPPVWDVLYLGGHPREPVTRYSEHLVRVGRWSCAEAYALNGLAVDRLLDYWLNRIGQPHAMFDFILGEFAAANHGYCVYPPITAQAVGYSTIGGKVDDKRELVERGWANNLPA